MQPAHEGAADGVEFVAVHIFVQAFQTQAFQPFSEF
jgi:hypothetical protein